MTLILCLIIGTAYAGDFQASKRMGPYLATIQIDRNPPIVGENHLEIEIKDAGGRVVSDAKVMVKPPLCPGWPR